jgi:DeoR family fructose operon transcriptional repressor
MRTHTAKGRLERIRALVAEHAEVSIADLAREFDVSEMTVRRDLALLADRQEIERTHGGAVRTERMVFEFEHRARRENNRAAKQAIARAARQLVKTGDRIILDTGTTTLEFARLLKDAKRLTVITPSIAVASELQYAPGVEVILLGGTLRRGNPDLTGPLTEHCLEILSADLAFQGADAISPDGKVYNSDLRLAKVDRVMRKQARKHCLLADSTKLGATALAQNGTLDDFDVFITDTRIDRQLLRRFRRRGLQVITVPAGPEVRQ